MRTPADIDAEPRDAVRAFIDKVATQYEVSGAILFGSRARKSYRPDSDADVAVLLHGGMRRGVAQIIDSSRSSYAIVE